MALRICAEPGCPEYVQQGRCAEHRRAKDRARGTRQERGYNAAHDALRASYQRRMDRGETFVCWRCAVKIDPKLWHLGHDDNDRSVYRGPECVPCNTATAGRTVVRKGWGETPQADPQRTVGEVPRSPDL